LEKINREHREHELDSFKKAQALETFLNTGAAGSSTNKSPKVLEIVRLWESLQPEMRRRIREFHVQSEKRKQNLKVERDTNRANKFETKICQPIREKLGVQWPARTEWLLGEYNRYKESYWAYWRFTSFNGRRNLNSLFRLRDVNKTIVDVEELFNAPSKITKKKVDVLIQHLRTRFEQQDEFETKISKVVRDQLGHRFPTFTNDYFPTLEAQLALPFPRSGVPDINLNWRKPLHNWIPPLLLPSPTFGNASDISQERLIEILAQLQAQFQAYEIFDSTVVNAVKGLIPTSVREPLLPTGGRLTDQFQLATDMRDDPSKISPANIESLLKQLKEKSLIDPNLLTREVSDYLTLSKQLSKRLKEKLF